MLEDISREGIKEQFKTNKKLRLTTMIVGAIAVIALGWFAYIQFVWNPANEESKDVYWEGLNLAVADSTDAAILELKKVNKEYDGKIGGEIAQFVLARQYMTKRQFDKAITELEGVDIEDTYVSVYAIGLKGDCYSEMKKYKKAANIYMEAANLRDNDLTTPTYLKKAGLCAEQLKDFKMAAECYERIRDEYASFARTNEIEKYVGRARSQVKG